MTLQLNHFSIRTLDLPACQHFYCDVLGLAVGPRPPFPFPGLWLYAGDTAVYANAAVHIIGIDRSDPAGLQQYLGDRAEASLQGTGAVDHLALRCFELGDAGLGGFQLGREPPAFGGQLGGSEFGRTLGCCALGWRRDGGCPFLARGTPRRLAGCRTFGRFALGGRLRHGCNCAFRKSPA